MRKLLVVAALLAHAPLAMAAGARSFKSGPIQITADGSRVWVVNPDHDSVSRIDTATEAVTEFALPQPPSGPAERHNPRGVSVKEDGSEVWVACHDSDRVYVLRGTDGAVLARIDLPWGSGPFSVALSRNQSKALVSCLRGSKLAVIDVATRQVASLLDSYRSPLGIAWLEDGVSAWVTHLHVLDRLTRVSRVDISGPAPLVTTIERTDGAGPQDNAGLHDADTTHNIAEGGYLTLRGHLAQVPAVPGGGRVWVPTQYGNRNNSVTTNESMIQATLRQIDLVTRRIPGTSTDKIVLTAKQVHDPQTATWIGPGWNQPIAGPADIAFSADGSTAYVVNELSENVVVMPVATPPYNNGVAPGPVTVSVGYRPQGIAVTPVAIGGKQLAYVANLLSRNVSVIDVTTTASPVELHRIPVTPTTPEPRSASFLNGERVFHSSNDPRISNNRKVACGSCHVYGEQDGRAWELEQLPGNHGPRQTQSILGLGASFGPIDPTTGLGQLHRSGDRDEVQDFDFTFRGPQMGGTGFIPAASLQPPLGAPNAGRDPDLDDLATYCLNLPALPHSPHRTAGGALSEAATRGATFFNGAGARAADVKCASCHVPETGFTDFKFHDVGSRHDANEHELNVRAPVWSENTPSLVGAWDSAPYVGAAAAKDPESMVDEILDFRSAGRTAPHGNVSGLTTRQLMDLAEFVDSIDGTMTASEARSAVDQTRPRVVRVEPASLTRVDVWFSESIANDAANPAAWKLQAVNGPVVPINGAVVDSQNRDRVTLTVGPLHHDCGPAAYTLTPVGAIHDLADTASGGVANLLDTSDPGNALAFVVGDTLTVTLGASGYENFTIPVHDAGTIFFSNDGANGSVWLRQQTNGSNRNVDFLRFEWESAFQATGIASSSDILGASISLSPWFGDAQTIEARRVLQKWWDYGNGDLFQFTLPLSGHGGPTYTWSEWNVKHWNTPNAGAKTSGVNGTTPAQYFAANDTAFDPDAVVTMQAINQPFLIASAGVLDAFRFWFVNPTLDYGYALRLGSGAQETKFHASEEELRQWGPVLTLTYRLPATSSAPPQEVSSPGSGSPLLMSAVGNGDIDLSFEDQGGSVGGYNVYEGTLGSFYSHTGKACQQSPPLVGGRREVVLTPSASSTYYLVTSYGVCVEGTAGADSAGTPRPAVNLDCAP